MTKKELISSFELDQLKEVVNIGASHASTALSQMLNKRVMISVPEALVDSIDNIVKTMGSNDDKVSAVVMRVLGDAPGILSFLFPGGCDYQLARLVMGESTKSGNGIMGDIEKSAITEVGNILAGASLTALSKFLDGSFLQSVSQVVQDMLGSIFNSVLAELAQSAEDVLVFKISFMIEGEDIKTELAFFLDPIATNRILELTKKKLGM